MAYMFYSKNYSSLEDVIKTLRDYASAFKRELNETEIRKAMESVEENKKKKKRFGIILVIVSSILLGILISHMMEDSAEELRDGENVEVYVEKGK
jgi:ABC-type transport system involved in cytochrome bd biosynthesis fused ATPase/permease subunit